MAHIISYSARISQEYFEKLESLRDKGGLPERSGNNPWLVMEVCGDGVLASREFKYRVFKNKKGELRLLTYYKDTLDSLLQRLEDGEF